MDEQDEEISNLINNLEDDYFAAVSDSAGRTAQKTKDYERLLELWVAERTCPDILPYETALLDDILVRLREQIETIEIANTSRERHDADKLKLLLIETELERVKFVVRGYVRARLHKIDGYMMHVLQSGEMQARLSPGEMRYARRREAQLRRYYDARFLSSLPPKLQRLDDTAGMIPMIEGPDLDRVVFVRVAKDVDSTLDIGDEDELELKKGNIYALPYRFISHHISLGNAQLV